MKKIFLSLILVLMTIGASAQVKTVDIKGDLRGDFGLGVGVTMGIANKFDFAPRFNYYFVGDGVTCFTIDADFHYNINVADKFTLYPIVGAVYYHEKDVDSFDKLGVNLGLGAKYQFTPSLAGFVEGKYQWVDGFDDSYFSLGIDISI